MKLSQIQKNLVLKHSLTFHQARVVELVSSGLTNPQIADALNVTEKTVKYHLTNVFKKMKIDNRYKLSDYVIARMR